jgi:site-specific DNA recombinase
LIHETLHRAVEQIDSERAALEAERRGLERDAGRWHEELRASLGDLGPGQKTNTLPRLADLQERLRLAEQRGSEIQARLEALDRERITEEEVATALGSFDPVWEALSPREQARIVQLLVERIDYDGGAGTIAITFHPAGLKALAAERSNTLVEQRA